MSSTHLRYLGFLLLEILLVLAVVPHALSQTGGVYNLSWNTTDGGGITFATGGAYQLGGTIGQHDAGASSGGVNSLTSGYWAVTNVIPSATATATPTTTPPNHTPTPTPTPKPTPTATATASPKATPTATPKTVLANISTRLKVETGDNILIGGFIITGTQPKKVIIRAIGPSLTIPGKLANPTLELRNSSGALLKANDDWKNSSAADKQAIIDSTIPPSNDLESAIVATLPANGAGYTAVVRGVNNTTGIGVVEMYDLDRNVDSKLANISTRGLVQTGDTVLIAGTIVLGPSSQKVIIRAIGPSLNIPGKLANPTLELRNGSGTLLDSNDDWKQSPDKQAIIDSTVPPTNDLESAIVATLPGSGASYTAIVRGVNNATGIAVVEVYALQ